MNILVVTGANLDSVEAGTLTRSLAEFGHLYVISVEPGKQEAPGVIQPRVPDMERRYPGASFFRIAGATVPEGVRLGLTTTDWLPSIDVVVVGVEQKSCFGTEAQMSAQTQAAMLAHTLGVTSLSLCQPGGARQEWDGIAYATERLLRLLSELPKWPHMALHVNVPNVRPNQLDGFSIVQLDSPQRGANQLYRDSVPWTFGPAEGVEQFAPGTDSWAIAHGRVAVVPLWGWGAGNVTLQLEAVSMLSGAIAAMGSSRAYRAAIARTLNQEVHYDYHFKGAALAAEPGCRSIHPAAAFSSNVDTNVEEPVLQHATGRVLDVGCGPGRIALYLMTKRHQCVSEVVGVDSNPVSLADYQRRWAQEITSPSSTYCLDARVDDFCSLGTFDTIVLFGDTLGIGGDPKGVADLLARLHDVIRRGGKLLISGRDALRTEDPDERLINSDNIRRGFSPGERYLRITFEGHDSGWFPCYYASTEELRDLGAATGWRMLEECIYTSEPNFYGVIMKAL